MYTLVSLSEWSALVAGKWLLYTTAQWPWPSQSDTSWQGYLHPSSQRGTPFLPNNTGWGYPPLGLDEGTSTQDWMACPSLPPSHQDWMGVPSVKTGWGYPPPPCQETEQQSEHLLCGGWYASCVHAGGLFVNYIFCSVSWLFSTFSSGATQLPAKLG